MLATEYGHTNFNLQTLYIKDDITDHHQQDWAFRVTIIYSKPKLCLNSFQSLFQGQLLHPGHRLQKVEPALLLRSAVNETDAFNFKLEGNTLMNNHCMISQFKTSMHNGSTHPLSAQRNSFIPATLKTTQENYCPLEEPFEFHMHLIRYLPAQGREP